LSATAVADGRTLNTKSAIGTALKHDFIKAQNRTTGYDVSDKTKLAQKTVTDQIAF
jgi:hypothetical protein